MKKNFENKVQKFYSLKSTVSIEWRRETAGNRWSGAVDHVSVRPITHRTGPIIEPFLAFKKRTHQKGQPIPSEVK
jgi:hypothetical protein